MEAGSITVFLTILFLLFFSLVGAAFENARVLSSSGYVRTAAHSAAMTVFGNYNKELYTDYGFFAFGGFDGKGAEDLADEFRTVFEENIEWLPEGAKVSYGDLYRLCEVDASVMETDILSDEKTFLKQVEAYLKHEAVEVLTDALLQKNTVDSGEKGIADKLTLTKEYEEGKFNASEEAEVMKGGISKEEGTVQPADTVADSGDKAGGNPLKSFSKMMRDGVLGLVCDSNTLADGVIEERNAAGEKKDDELSKEKAGAADYLRGILGEEDALQEEKQGGVLEKGINKVKYICYANKQFSCYTKDKNRTTKYGREYLAAGRREERDNLSKIVNKLLRIRLLLNFTTIASNVVLQEKSMATATVLAGFTGMPPVIQAVQYTILLILAFEEACIDVMALLDGKKVPVLKSAESLKMRYEEICFASKALFKRKAAEYQGKVGNSAANITYEQYLWIFLLEQSEEELHERSLDLIQYDLREKYNQTFTIDTCICRSRYVVHYRIPYLFEKLPFLSGIQKNGVIREMEVDYGYKSG